MQLNTAFKVACALGVLGGTASGFVTPQKPLCRTSVASLGVHRGWDNDEFINALGGGSDALKKANDKYNRQSRFNPEEPPVEPPAPQAPPRRAASKADDEEEEDVGQGGSRFKELLQRAQSPGRSPTPGSPPPPQYEPYQEPDQQQAPPVSGLDNLSVEDQARLFREFMADQKQPGAAVLPPKNQMRGGVDAQGRKIGRNKDADSIANSSDVYFAQLKRDSSIRTAARSRGDDETAEKVFADPSIREIEEQLRKNPYLSEKEARSRSFVEGTSAEESLIMVPGKVKTSKPETYSGVSFRKKLEEVKRKKTGGAAKVPPKAAAAPEAAAPKSPPKAKVAPTSVKKPVVTKPKKAPVASKPVVVDSPTKPEPKPVVAAATPPEPVGETNEELRRDLRTLMGLIIKHRGGPGFGAGRLKGAEAERLQTVLADVSATLRSEAGMAPAVQAAVQPTSTPTPVSAPAPAAPAPVATRAAPAATLSVEDALSSTIACVEGAVEAYKRTPEDLREGAMVTLRAALMAAVNTCNKAIAENEVANKEAYETAAVPASSPTGMDFPDTFTLAPDPMGSPPAAAVAAAAKPAPAAPAKDVGPNTQLLEKLYDQLQAAKGDEQLGLKGSLTPDEASELADQLVEMRSVLVEELDTGLEEATTTPIAPTSIMSPEAALKAQAKTGTSKYQQRLEKAKQEKMKKQHKWWEEIKKTD